MRFRFSRTTFRRLLIVTAALCLLWAGSLVWKTWLRPWLFPTSPLLSTPQVVLRGPDGLASTRQYVPNAQFTPEVARTGVVSKSLYYNAAALPWLARMRPELIDKEVLDPESLRARIYQRNAPPTAEEVKLLEPESRRARAYWQATQNPILFRQLDRQYRFDTVLLIDDPSNYQRLLDDFLTPDLDKRDFRLVYLDHWAIIFRRNAAREWQPSDAEPLKQTLAGLNSEDRAAFLAQTAAKMLAIRQFEAAKGWLDEAERIDSDSIDVLAGFAVYYTRLSKWPEVLSYANRALEQNENFIPALQAKISALSATTYMKDAFKVSTRLNLLLMAQNPTENPVRLMQHAQVAHQAKEYVAEVEALTRLIALAAEERRSAGEYELHLGQAHAFLSLEDAKHAPLAVKHLKIALADPTLPLNKRRFAETTLAEVGKRTGLK